MNPEGSRNRTGAELKPEGSNVAACRVEVVLCCLSAELKAEGIDVAGLKWFYFVCLSICLGY